MPPLYAYKYILSKKQVGMKSVPIVEIDNAVEGKEYYCGCMDCAIDAKVIFKNGKFKIKYGDGKNHSKLCKRLSKFDIKKFDETSFDFEKAIEEMMT